MNITNRITLVFLTLITALFSSCSPDQETARNIETKERKSSPTYTIEEIELAVSLLEYAEAMAYSQNISNENIENLNVASTEYANSEDHIKLEEIAAVVSENSGIDQNTLINFQYFLIDNKSTISNFSDQELYDLLRYTFENGYYTQSKGAITTVAGWFGVGGDDSSCGTRVALGFAEIAVSGAVAVASGGTLAPYAAANMAIGYLDLVATIYECS